jgi:hypothetical protein
MFRMRILLLNPPAEFTAREYADPANPADHGLLETEDFGLFPPLGLLYILGALHPATKRSSSTASPKNWATGIWRDG